MRRTTSRSSTRSGARRASSSRSKRSKRAVRPRLSSLQIRELLGVLLFLAALVAGLVIGLIVTVHFSPGALLVTAVGAVRAANAERARLRDLVAAPSAEKARPGKPAPATSDLLTRSATILATAPATKDQPGLW